MTHHSHFRLDALGGDVHLERVNLGVLRVAKVEDLYSQNQYGTKSRVSLAERLLVRRACKSLTI